MCQICGYACNVHTVRVRLEDLNKIPEYKKKPKKTKKAKTQVIPHEMIPQYSETVEVKSESKTLVKLKMPGVRGKRAPQSVKQGVRGKKASQSVNLDVSGKTVCQTVKPDFNVIDTPSQPKVHKCHKCNCTFNSMELLKEHKASHYDNKIYKCMQCDFFAVRASNLSTHVKHTHDCIKAHRCHVCEKCFFTKGHLHQHLRIHSGYKPFECYLCSRPFVDRSKLKRHMNVHNKKKVVTKPVQPYTDHTYLVQSETDVAVDTLTQHM